MLAALVLAPLAARCADADTTLLRVFIFAGQSNMEGADSKVKDNPSLSAVCRLGRDAGECAVFILHRITNAAGVGISSLIQSLKHAACGLPAFKTFRTRILFFLDKLDLNPA